MVAEKLRAIWRIIGARQVLLFTIKNEKVASVGFGKEPQSTDVIRFAVSVEKASKDLSNMVEALATETGELRVLQDLRKVVDEQIEEVSDGRD